MDERRHNMDGALFVDDEQGEEDRPERARPRRRDDGEKAEDARRVTQGILDRMDLEARVTIREDDERVVLDIDGPDAGRAIGKKGMTLEALQFLVNKIVNRDPDERRHIVLDSGDYRDRHDSGLVAMAKREAKRAISSGRAVTLEPMSARDRRVIHVSLAKFPGVSTRSEGEGNDRRLQIIPARGARSDDRPRGDRDRDRGGRGRGGDARGPRPARDRGPERAPANTQERADDRPREPAYADGERSEYDAPARDYDRDYDDRP
ncbi:MAG TPA: R3H domain-containing nucleic acid-binding protein [Polyangiales bacterium]